MDLQIHATPHRKRDWWTGEGAVAERRDSRVGNCHWLDSKSGCSQQSSPFGSPPFSQQLHLDVIDTFSNDASDACPTDDWPVCQPHPVQHEMGEVKKCPKRNGQRHWGGNSNLLLLLTFRVSHNHLSANSWHLQYKSSPSRERLLGGYSVFRCGDFHHNSDRI